MADSMYALRIHHFELRLGLRPGFVSELRRQDDWSFIIRSHALLEAGLAQLLAHQFGEPEGLLEFCSGMPTGGKYGKLGFAEELKLVDRSTIQFIRALGLIRNHIVHKISDIDFELRAYMQGLVHSRLVQAHKALDLVWSDMDPNAPIADPGGDLPITPLILFAKHPKAIIGSSLRAVLFDLHLATEGTRAGLEARKAYDDAVRALLVARLGSSGTLGDILGHSDAAPPDADDSS
jgi:hypothetical protein